MPFTHIVLQKFLALSGCGEFQGMRTAMPLTRVALMSPAGAARGQVCNLHFSSLYIVESSVPQSLIVELGIEGESIPSEGRSIVYNGIWLNK
jgi:hypothetical protein